MSEIEAKLRKKIGDNADEIIDEVKIRPDYFVMEGGADGTFPHIVFWSDYGCFMPEISDFAYECGGRV